MNSNQGILPGFEGFFVEPAPYQWKPRPGMLSKVKSYFEGYQANRRDIYARRKHIAERLGISVRTLARYLAHLASLGWIETVKRTARTAIRKVLSIQPDSSTSVPSTVPPIEVKPTGTKVLLRREMLTPLVVFLAPVQRAHQRLRSAIGKVMQNNKQNLQNNPGFSEGFKEYIGIFYAAGKAMNTQDIQRAHAAWIGIGSEEWDAATKHALEQCQRTRHAQFVPMPVNHLLDRGWTRVAPARTLPYIDTTVSRQDANHAEAARRFKLEMEMPPPADDDFSPAARRYRQRAARRAV